jgi:hypothetical protein
MQNHQQAAIRSVTNAYSGEAAVPSSGRFASASFWIDNLPADADLNVLEAWIDGARGEMTYIGSDPLAQVNVTLPAGVRTGLLPVEVRLRGAPLAAAWMRVVPPGPVVPRLALVSDGVNLLSGAVTSGAVKLTIEEVADPAALRVSLDRDAIDKIDSFCTDPVSRTYQFNVHLPRGVQSGWYALHLTLGRRTFPPIRIEVA